MDELSALVKKYKATPTSYSPTEMRACLDGFRDVLFEHLDQEVGRSGLGRNLTFPVAWRGLNCDCACLFKRRSHMFLGRRSQWRQYEEVLDIGGSRSAADVENLMQEIVVDTRSQYTIYSIIQVSPQTPTNRILI